MDKICKVCNKNEIQQYYSGKIRFGKPGNYLDDQTIYICNNCKIQFYESSVIDYAKHEYRELIQPNSAVDTYYKIHDKEQLNNIEMIGIENLRDKSIADIGCGAGSFLDLVRGLTSEQIAVEPFSDYQKSLTEKGYKVYDYAHKIDKSYYNKIDIVTSFAVIEHVNDPIKFLSDLKNLVTDNGYILISTPNANDFLINLLGDDYRSFFYRYVHQWYFTKESLEFIAKKLKFRKIEFFFKHRYDLSNLIFWLKDKKPTGNNKLSIFKDLDRVLSKTLEGQEISDYIYVKFFK